MTTLRTMIRSAFLVDAGSTRFAQDGVVTCSFEGRDVDIDRCFGCRFFQGASAGPSGTTRIHCDSYQFRPLDRL